MIQGKLHNGVQVGPRIVTVDSGDFFNRQDKIDEVKMFEDEPVPVDVFGAFVPQDKDNVNMDNLKMTEEQIHKRFGLCNCNAKKGGEV
jgi:hypothetical protein